MHPARSKAAVTVRVAGVALVASAVALAGGCYRRVVGARGIGTSGVETQDSTPPPLLDRLLGPAPVQGESRPRMRVN